MTAIFTVNLSFSSLGGSESGVLESWTFLSNLFRTLFQDSLIQIEFKQVVHPVGWRWWGDWLRSVWSIVDTLVILTTCRNFKKVVKIFVVLNQWIYCLDIMIVTLSIYIFRPKARLHLVRLINWFIKEHTKKFQNSKTCGYRFQGKF